MHFEENKILKLEDKLIFADASSDPDTSDILRELLFDQLTLIGPDGHLVTKEFVLDAHRPPKKQTFLSVIISEREMKKCGHAYVVISKGEFKTEVQTFSLRFSRMWEKEDGEWKVFAGTITLIT